MAVGTSAIYREQGGPASVLQHPGPDPALYIVDVPMESIISRRRIYIVIRVLYTTSIKIFHLLKVLIVGFSRFSRNILYYYY